MLCGGGEMTKRTAFWCILALLSGMLLAFLCQLITTQGDLFNFLPGYRLWADIPPFSPLDGGIAGVAYVIWIDLYVGLWLLPIGVLGAIVFKKTPHNKASDATSKPAPGAGSSAHQR